MTRVRRARLLALWVASAVGSVIAGGAAARLILFPSDVAEDTSLLGYQLVRARAARAGGRRPVSFVGAGHVADLVVELGEERSDRLRDVLARALGDPTLEVGYWSSATNGYIDSSGRPLPLPAAGDGRAATAIGTASDPIGILIHHPSLLDDPGLPTRSPQRHDWPRSTPACRPRFGRRSSSWKRHDAGSSPPVTSSTVASSAACEAERNAGSKHFAADSSRQRPDRRRNRHEPLQSVAAHLAETLDDLRMLAAGLHPRLLTSAGSSPPWTPSPSGAAPKPGSPSTAGAYPPRWRAAAYFVCSEALANIDKHAAATSASVGVTVGDRVVRIHVCDNGVGGADPRWERAAQPGRPGPRPRRDDRPHQSSRRRDVSGGGVAGG